MHIGMTEAMVKIGEEIWTVPVHYNFLVAINVNTGATRYICQITEKKSERLYSEIVNYKNEKLFFIPMSADSMAVYDMVTGNVECIDIPFPKEYIGKTHYNEIYKFARCRIFEDEMYIFPYTFPAIIKMNPESYEMEYYSDWVDTIEEEIEVREEVYFRDCFVKEDVVYMASCCSNTVLEFDVKTKKSIVHVVGEKPFSTITWMDDWFYLSSKQGNELIRLKNLKDRRFQKIPGTDRFPAIAAHVLNGKLYVISSKSEETYCLDEGNNLTNIDLEEDIILDVLLNDNVFWYIGENKSILGKYEKKHGADKHKVELILENVLEKQIIKKYEDNGLYREGVIGLREYIRLLDREFIGLEVNR